MLQRIELPTSVDQIEVPAEIDRWIREARQQIEAFQDRWDRPLIEQFVAADYELVYKSILWTKHNALLVGNRFLEWGCGFAVISAFASTLGFDVVGIDAEPDLLDQADELLSRWQVSPELTVGNFLPSGSESLADDPTLPSLGHHARSAYEKLGLDLDDFAIVYDYPWPGEDDFHEAVFERYAAIGALMMQFCGPNDVRLWRKTK